MCEQQLCVGRDAPDYSSSTSDSVIVSVPLSSADLDLVRFLLTFENESQQTLGLDELRIVHEVRATGSATGGELSESLSMLLATVRAIATRLVKLGIFEARGNGRSRKYHLTARFTTLLRTARLRAHQGRGPSAAGANDPRPRHCLRFDRAKRGRRAVSDLCVHARYLLKNLVDQGRLRLVGERRAARYELAGG